jgi:hypothetical protein
MMFDLACISWLDVLVTVPLKRFEPWNSAFGFEERNDHDNFNVNSMYVPSTP